MLKKIRDRVESMFTKVSHKDYHLFREDMARRGMRPAGKVLVYGNPDISAADSFKVSFDNGRHWVEFNAMVGTRSFRGVILSRKASDSPSEAWLIYDKMSKCFYMYEQSKEERLNSLIKNHRP